MLRRTPRVLLLVWLLATAAAVALQLLIEPGRAWLTIVEALFSLAVLVWMGAAMAPFFAALGARTKRVLLAALGLMLFGQFAQESRLTYPAVQWGMYSGVPPRQIAVMVYEAHTRSGAVREVDPLRAFPSLNSFRISYLLQDLATESAKPGAPPELAGLWHDTLVSMGQQLNRHDGTDPVVSIEVFRGDLDGETWHAGEPISWEPLLTVEIP